MRNKVIQMTAAASMIFTLSACGSSTGTLPDEPYEAVPYNLYPIPEDAYVGDTMPFVTDDGTLELYYLYDTDHNGQGYHPVWKYSTKNLYEYKDHGMVLNFGLMSDPDPAIGTGSVMQDKNGLYHLFYTGHNDAGNGGKGKECVMHATSTDREHWTKIPEDTFFSEENYSKDDFRDPEVFWVDEENCYWLLIAAREQSMGGVVAKYTSTDLKNWEFKGPIYAPFQQYMLECPDLFKMGNKYYLTYSWDCVTYYAVSDSLNGPFTAPHDNVLDGTGFIFYAAKTAELNGARYLCGWLGRAALTEDSGMYQWAGNVLNHQLVQKEDGTLGVKAPDTFKDYFKKEKEFKAVAKSGKTKIKGNTITLTAEAENPALADMGTRAPSMTLECDVRMDNDGVAGFAFGGSEKDPTWTVLCLDGKNGLLHYEGYEMADLAKFDPAAWTKFDFSVDPVHHVKLVCENEIVVMYVDDTKVLSSRIRHSTNGAHIGVFAETGNAEFSNIKMTLPEK
ncbi:MAG: family 43 glycosylhydrolase [Solobacterium sp.]|nr:family 43 glycosylhydrolase [Solobacterium sp.]